MKFLAYFSVLLLIDIYSPSCRAHPGRQEDSDYPGLPDDEPGGSDEHRDRETTRLPGYESTHRDHSRWDEDTTVQGVGTADGDSYTVESSKCDRLSVHPQFATASVRQNVTLVCSCLSRSRVSSFSSCPEWRHVYGVLHSQTLEVDGNKCTVTLQLVNVDFKMTKHFKCTGENLSERSAHLSVMRTQYDENCQEDNDCAEPFQCKDSRCSCPDSDPIYLSDTQQQCHSARRLLSPCWKSVQCQATDLNSYCKLDPRNSTGEGHCLCRSGYESFNRRCVRCGSVYLFVSGLSRQYRIVFYVLLATSIALFLVGLLRICFLRRRGPVRRMGHVVSTSGSDGKPIVTTEKEKDKH